MLRGFYRVDGDGWLTWEYETIPEWDCGAYWLWVIEA